MLSIKLSENNGNAPEAVPFMPAGQHSICATVNGQPGRRMVTVDKEACERLQADLAEHLRASDAGEKARPMLMFDHAAGNAAAKPLGFEWDDKRGILLRVEWTKAGREAVEGGNYGYISPAFRLARGTGQILGLSGGVEVGSLVNDPAFERNECIAASRADEPEEVSVDYVETANPWGCNQHGHREGHEDNKQELSDFDKEILQWVKEFKGDSGSKKKIDISLLDAPIDGSNVRKEIERLIKDKDKWIEQNWGKRVFEEYKEDIMKQIKRLLTEKTSGKKKSNISEMVMSSVPPRGDVENNTHARDNVNVANKGGVNHKAKMEEIKNMLGLPPDADDAAVLSAIRSLKAQGAEAKTKTEAVEAECEQHKKALKEHKEKAADSFVKRLQKDGTLAPKDEERAKAARTLYMTDPEQAETLFCGLRSVHSKVVDDEVRANRVTGDRSVSEYANKSLEELLNEN